MSDTSTAQALARSSEPSRWFPIAVESFGFPVRPRKSSGLFAITHLFRILEFANPEDVVGTRAADRRVVACPICEPPTWIPIGPDEYQTCASCRTQLMVFPPSIEEGEIACGTVRIPTYDNEYVKLVVTEQVIWVDGRLDLFASEVVQDVWRLVPRPRRTIFAVPYAGLTPAGLQPLIDICAASNDADRSTIVITDVIESPRQRASTSQRAHRLEGSTSRARCGHANRLPPSGCGYGAREPGSGTRNAGSASRSP